MSFQAYPDSIEARTGLTPRQFLNLAHERGFDASTQASPIIEWLRDDYGIGRGHAMALVHVITKGPGINAKHVGGTGTHRDPSDTLWLDGAATRPQEAVVLPLDGPRTSPWDEVGSDPRRCVRYRMEASIPSQ